MLYRCSDKFDNDDIIILIVGNDTKLKHNNVKEMCAWENKCWNMQLESREINYIWFLPNSATIIRS